ncbi:iron-sulfur cluster assembly protein [Halegenticoccus tardaugens]|uniref:iron-sulfur cluster assembly protein n=1 Tax=Halegenticoccus tardaugens TaxID=2071624 RepID=UPI00100BE554|nr:iron-sulfur cluster assembly protein [Halegenticoccus tardaugens]
MSDANQDPETPTRGAVLDRLDRVTDPELDRSLVELDYVDEIEIAPPTVRVAFSLPTAWCSPAFAWMMAIDARESVEALPGVDVAVVELRDHLHDAEINRGVNGDLSFAEAFPDADGDVAAVRRDLDAKARLARQYRAVSTLLDAGLSPEQIVDLVPSDVDLDDETGVGAVFVRDGAVGVSFPADPLAAYVEKARATGLVAGGGDSKARDGANAESEGPLFRTPEGEPISLDEFDLVHRRARSAHVNLDGQGGVCAYLHEARHGDRAASVGE